jgi:PBSX family phage portal protein
MGEPAVKETVKPFEAKVVDKDGVINTRKMNVRILRVEKPKIPKSENDEIERQLPSTTTAQNIKVSNVTPLEDTKTYQDIIKAPYDLFALAVIEEHSNVLRECIDAMVVNIEGFGNIFRPRKVTEEAKQKHKREIEQESIRLESWLPSICPDPSFVETRKRMRRDEELTGGGYWEIVRDPSDGKTIIEINHTESHRMRLTKLDEEPTTYKVPMVDPSNDYKIKWIERRKRFRRYVQIDSSGKPQTYFKEIWDPRKIDKTTGKVNDKVEITNEATEMKYFKIYSSRTPYGIPRHIGRYVALLGSRRAEETNFFTISNNYIPSMFIMVANGTLTDGSVKRLNELIESQIGDDPNYSKFIILEAENSEDEGFPGQITTSKLGIHETRSQKTDEMFQKYDDNNQKKVIRAYRLAPLVVGRADEYTRATATAGMRVTDEQVFAPEREQIDSFMDLLMLDQGYRWHHFRSRTPNITDNDILTKFMEKAEKSGAMTPRRADVLAQDVFQGDLGPMPEGINLDQPYSLQFAQAQNAQRPPTKPVEREDWARQMTEASCWNLGD